MPLGVFVVGGELILAASKTRKIGQPEIKQRVRESRHLEERLA